MHDGGSEGFDALNVNGDGVCAARMDNTWTTLALDNYPEAHTGVNSCPAGERLRVTEVRMYRIRLGESLFPAQDDVAILEETLGDALRRVTAARPDGAALVEVTLEGQPARRWSYAALLADAERLALAFASRWETGTRIAVWSPNSPEWVIVEYACALAGLTLVTVNPAYQLRELAYVLRQSGAVALLHVEAYRGNPMGEIARAVAAELPAIRDLVDMEDPAQLFATGPRPAVLPAVAPDDPLMIQYTSGTTGFPKGAVLHHRGTVNNGRLYKTRMGMVPGSRWINFMPMFHTGGSCCMTQGCLQAEGCLYVCRLFEPAAMLRLIAAEDANAILAVPTMLLAMCEAQAHLQLAYPGMRMVVSGGSMVAPDLVRRVRGLFDCDFQIIYGQTETSPVACQSALDDSLEDICTSVGQPLPQTELSIRDPAENTVQPCGTVGEICIRGYLNMIGYNDDPAATAATIDTAGWLHTGDLGTMDDRGYVAVTGRVKEMIIRGGENLFPAEIENLLLEHPAVAEVAVVGLPDERWGEVVAAFIRSPDGAALPVDELKRFCRAHLAPQKTPTLWIPVADFPLTGSGKVQKFRLREMYETGGFARA